MMDDAELLNRYALNGDEGAFSELVQRCLPLVYSAALRQVRRPEIAEEVTQVVFVILARKAKRLHRDVILSGWLYQTTRYASHRAIRTETRRIKREREAAQQGAQMEQSETNWNAVEPMLDDLMARLREQDRLVLVLRFFEGQSLAEIGSRLGTSEDAAQKRVARALERLRALFSKKSVHTSTAGLASLLGTYSVGAVPVGLAAGVLVTATSSAATMAPLTVTLLKSTLNMMTWIKIKTLVPVGAAVAVAASVPIVGLHHQKTALEDENRALQAASVAVADYSAKSEELESLKLKVSELEALREQAKEVHRLRAKVSQMNQERTAMLAQIDGLERASSANVMSVETAESVEVLSAVAEERIALMGHYKKLALALHMYAGSHEGKFPSAISDLDEDIVEDVSGAISLDDLVMIDYGTLESIEEPEVSVVFSSREPIGQDDGGAPVWVYAFGDGHSEISSFELGEDGKLIR